MNYFAHGSPFTHDPYYLVGTALPDLLSVVDRQVRVRAKGAKLWIDNADPQVSAIARGIVQHHADDDWFHQTAAFNELNIAFTGRMRALLPGDDGYRPAFLGHILIEILLDSHLIQKQPALLDEYYRSMAAVDPQQVQNVVNRLATKPTEQLVQFLPRFLAERFLYDYQEDAKLLIRLNQVMRRVGLPLLPESVCELFSSCRREVAQRAAELLSSPSISADFRCPN